MKQITYCAPSKKNNKITCFSMKSLVKIANTWNKKRPDKIKLSKNKNTLWRLIKDKFINNTNCQNDFCILKNPLIQNLNDGDMIYETFVPETPEEWNNNPRSWLSTSDIRLVLLQYEALHPNFEFIGPVPIDFDKNLLGGCVSDELCKICLDKLLSKKKTKIGIVFNLDAHDMPGSHWVSLYIDLNNGGICYFDSVGIKPCKEIYTLMKKLWTQGNNLLEKEVIDHNDFERTYQYPIDITKINDFTIRADHIIPNSLNNLFFETLDSNDNLKFSRIKNIEGKTIHLNKPIQGKIKNGNIYGFRLLFNDITHQKKNTECGMYSIFFISQMVSGEEYYKLCKNIVNDDKMNQMRKLFYRPN